MAADIGLARLGYGLILPAAKIDLQGAYHLYGSVATLHLAGYLVGSICTPLLLRRYGWRLMFFLSHLIVGIALIGQSLALTVEGLAFVRTILGVATGVGTVTALGASLELVAAARRSTVSAFIWAGVAAGIVVSAPVGPWVLEIAQRWRDASVWMALPALTVAVLSLFAYFPPESSSAGIRPARLMEGFRQLQSSLFLLLTYAAFGFAYLIYATFVMSRAFEHVTDDAGIGTALLWAAYGSAAVIGAAIIVPIMRGKFHNHALSLSLGVAVAGALVSAWPGQAASIAGALFIGLGLTATPAVASAYARERIDAASGPDAIAAATVAAAAGQMAGPFVAGYVIDWAGLASIPLLVASAYSVAAILAFVDYRKQSGLRIALDAAAPGPSAGRN